MSRTQKIVAGLVAAALIAGGVAAWIFFQPDEVATVGVTKRDVSEVYVVTGRVRSRTTSGIGSELAGRISDVHVREGSTAKRADPLVDLQPIDAKLAVAQAEANLEIARRELQRVKRGPTKAQLERARANLSGAEADLAQARRDLERIKGLTDEGLGTQAELEAAMNRRARAEANVGVAQAQLEELRESPRTADIRVAEARLKAAEANLEQASATLGKTTITAPFDGLVLELNATIGENVRPGEPLVTLARVDDLEYYAEVDEDYFARIETGQTATVVFPSMPERQFEATVSQVGPDVDPDRGVVAVHLDAVELPPGIVPGLSADVAIELARLKDATAVPVRAIAREKNQPFVLVIRDGVATRVDVDVRADGEDYVAVSGLDDDDSVIADIALVEEGQKVRATR